MIIKECDEHARRLLAFKKTSRTRFIYDCVVLARYLKSRNYEEEEIIDELILLGEQIGFEYVVARGSTGLADVMKYSEQFGEMINKEINFSRSEIKKISSIKNNKVKNVCFIMLFLSKYYDGMFKINKESLFRASLVRSKKVDYGNKTLYRVNQENMFKIGERKNRRTGKIELLYWATEECVSLYDENDIVITITNYVDVVYYYLKYVEGEKIVLCKECKAIFKENVEGQEYCDCCLKLAELGHCTLS